MREHKSKAAIPKSKATSTAHSRPVSRARRLRYQPIGGQARLPEVYFVKHIDNSRLRREVDPVERRRCLTLLGLGTLVFTFGLLFAWQHFECVRCGYQTEQLKAQRAAMEEWNHRMRLEQAALADPQRIDTLARKELGLSLPGPQRVIPLKGDEDSPTQVGSPEFARNFSAIGTEASSEQ